MAFQTSVFLQQGFGIPGELYTDSPHISESYIINSASAAYNIVGATAFTITSQGVAQAGNGGSLGLAGVLANPKVYRLRGTTGSLSPSMTLANYTQGEFVTMGKLIVNITNTTASIGDWLVYDNTTGALTSVAPNASLPTGKSWLGATFIDYYTVASPGLIAVIALNPSLAAP